MKKPTVRFLTALWLLFAFSVHAAPNAPMEFIEAEIAAHAGKSGVYVLETGAEALLARAWLAGHARHTIDVQYFIWSTDNIGVLAAEALLRAAERGVQVRVIVDALLIDVPDKSLLALARHPNVDIRIYNPQTSQGISLPRRAWNVIRNFRGVNQRMHDKVVIIDGKVAVTGGRNMAAEYYDYNHQYNFRDRDVLVFGTAVNSVEASFETFWNSNLTITVGKLYDGYDPNLRLGDDEVNQVYRELHKYAASPENFAPEVRAAIDGMPAAFPRLAKRVVWANVEFISDRPGKNDNRTGLHGGGQTTMALARLIDGARKSIVIQSPYLVLSDEATQLFERAMARGVIVRVSTNSLASTDNIPAFSGYRNQRKTLLKMGFRIYEYKPDPEIRHQLIQRISTLKAKPPVFSLHAKTLVIDGEIVYVGTFNFDPRSANLNTEVGAIIRNEKLARAVDSAIETDMQPGNSWNAATDNPDQYVSLIKRAKVMFWQLMPIKSLL